MHAKIIRQHDPDPHYIRHVLAGYLDAAERAINGIFSDANTCFGLGIRRRAITRDVFEDALWQRSRQKKGAQAADILASEFLKWYDTQYAKRWHAGTLARMMAIVRHTRLMTGQIPDIITMITPKHRHKDDPTCEIDISRLTHNGRLRSREELYSHMQREMPVFLEVLNHKRHQKGEVKASAGRDVTVSTFAVLYDNGGGSGDDTGNHTPWPAARHILSSYLSHAGQKGAHAQRRTPEYMPVADAVRSYTHTVAAIKSESESRARKIISDRVASAISFTRQGRI